MLKKFVKAAGFGIEARKREFASGDLMNKLIAALFGDLRSRCYERFSSHLSLL